MFAFCTTTETMELIDEQTVSHVKLFFTLFNKLLLPHSQPAQ
jgi:hypothetical protein